MLPKVTELSLPTENGTDEPIESIDDAGLTYLFDFATGDFVTRDGKMIEVEGVEALKMWIQMVLRTEVGRYKVYEDDEDYGVQIEDLFGFDRDFARSEIKREISNALLENDEIDSLTNWDYEFDGSKLELSFRVNSIYGTHDEGVELSG
ncbi:DUF2634 domain-containing protein [Salsuginibacillus kocurii]|uniref:DUF2634 domain-containing protein n=1 Tax=Salsuginibacillus kocurii TaxID=427078 RepID=UPI00037955A5|nr:DUF2634 domain-containing protein [Salsuginibacillus kocurii]